ncbi:MAG: hypothetical protein ACO3EZ_16785, partial [Prochlorotrichaceae cyanobacterium]
QAVNLLTPRFWFPELDLGLGVWDGVYERWSGLWLRWYDRNGWIPTPEERAEAANQRAEEERQRAEAANQRADQEREEKERLAAYLRSLGLDPDRLPPP